MAGTYKPIAGLTPDNYGPVNTVVAIFLCSTTVLFSSIRFAIGRRRLLQLDTDDAAYYVALVLGITASVLSQATVGPGLGRHQDTLRPDQLDAYFKFFWANQFLTILAMAFTKLSVSLMFSRIVPAQQAPHTLKILIPAISLYAVVSILLVAFQCNPPKGWMLDTKTCSTHGNVYYATTVLNILTDALLTGWIVPSIWALQMQRRTKYTIIALFTSRSVVCVVDFVRIFVIRRALRSDDLTWNSLGWACIDQVVVHLSINQATLPRVHVFLGNLQTGLLTTRITAKDRPKGTKGSRGPYSGNSSGLHSFKKAISSKNAASSSKPHSNSMLSGLFSSKRSSGYNRKPGSISENPLNLHPENGIELSTSIYAGGDRPSTNGSDGNGKGHGREDWITHSHSRHGSVTVFPREQRPGHIGIQKTVEVRTEPASPLQ